MWLTLICVLLVPSTCANYHEAYGQVPLEAEMFRSPAGTVRWVNPRTYRSRLLYENSPESSKSVWLVYDLVKKFVVVSAFAWPFEAVNVSFDKVKMVLETLSNHLDVIAAGEPMPEKTRQFVASIAKHSTYWENSLRIMINLRYNNPAIGGIEKAIFEQHMSVFFKFAKIVGPGYFQKIIHVYTSMVEFFNEIEMNELEVAGITKLLPADDTLRKFARLVHSKDLTIEDCVVYNTYHFNPLVLLDYQRLLISDFVKHCVNLPGAPKMSTINVLNAHLSTDIYWESFITPIQLGSTTVDVFKDSLSRMKREIKLGLSTLPTVEFRDSEARGDGPRNVWVSNTLREAIGRGYFVFSDERELYMKPAPLPSGAAARRSRLSDYVLLGRLIGFALRLSISSGIWFTPACLQMLRSANDFDDEFAETVWEIEDPVAAHSTHLLAVDDIGEMKGYDFPPLSEKPSRKRKMETLSSENVDSFVKATRNHRINFSVRLQMRAILQGMYDVLDYGSLEYLTIAELEEKLRGPAFIDVHQLKDSTTLTVPATTQHVEWFWDVVGSYTQEELEKLLTFVTGAHRPPIGGFPDAYIQLAVEPDNVDYLPKAQTCFKRLILSKYTDKATLKQKLDYAIQHGSSTVELY